MSTRKSTLGGDVQAGVTVALVAIPQCMAFATIAGLPPAYGLYAAVVMAMVGGLLSALAVFGWISRRFERQADAFAARHLSRASGGDQRAVTGEAVAVVSSALESIALLNAVALERPSWRHGSIAWRRDYLATLEGRPLDGLPIDRQIGWIKGSTAAA